MRKVFFFLAASLVIHACEFLGGPSGTGMGELRISFADRQDALTRSGLNIPDTSDLAR